MDATTFGPFTLLKKIAEGGMAVTWLARVSTDEPGREFVLKRILPNLADDPELRALFVEEARTATLLDHEHVVNTWDLGDVDGEYWLAMEYIWGVDLQRVVERSQAVGRFIPLRFVVDLIARAARGLYHAHNLHDAEARPIGLVHRDISPPNLMVGFDGRLKVVDFGIARAESHWMNVRAGQLKGKFSYMSPEQVQGLEVDARSDIFSLGVILYELTTRRRLFREESDVLTIKAVSEARVEAPHRVRADYPPRLGEIVMKALSRDPDDRYTDAGAFAEALEGFLAETRQNVDPAQVAGWMRDIFPDAIEEIEAAVAPGYTGPTGAPNLPKPPAPEPEPVVAPPPPTPAGDELGSVVSPLQDLYGDDDFDVPKRGANPILWVIGVLVLAALAAAGYHVAKNGIGTGVVDSMDAGPSRDDFDAEPLPPPDPPAVVTYRITSTPTGANVVVNGVAMRDTTPTDVDLVQDAVNSVSVHQTGHAPVYETVTVGTSGGALDLSLVAFEQPEDWEPPEPEEDADPEDVITEWTVPQGRIRVEATSPGGPVEDAQVLLNGVTVDGTTPVEFDVDADVLHHITVRAAGHRDAVTWVRARVWDDAADTRHVRLEMPSDESEAVITTLRVTTTPSDATVMLDGEDQGRVNQMQLRVPGHYVLEVEAPDHERYVRAFDAGIGTFEVNALLDAIETGPSVLNLTVEPEGTQIFLGSTRHGSAGARQVGTTVVEARETDAGPYELTLFYDGEEGRQRGEMALELEPNTVHTIEAHLEDGTIVIDSHETAPIEDE